MTKKKKWSIIATCLSLVVCVALCGLLWWQMTKPERIEIPVPQLQWGMSAAEVEAVLTDAGIENAKVGGISDDMNPNTNVQYASLKLSTEEMQKLGVDEILGFPFSSQRSYAVLLRFAGSTDGWKYIRTGSGALRLAQVEFWVEVPEGSSFKVAEVLTSKLDREYGKAELPKTWVIIGDEAKALEVDGMSLQYIISPEVTFSQKNCGIGEVKLVYEGAGYVQYLHGGAFSLPPSWYS